MYLFAKRNRSAELFPYVRRICDLTTPNLPQVDSVGRSENRLNRAIPTLLCPWERNRPVADESSICLTCDMSDRGARLMLNQPIDVEEIVLGYWIQDVDMPEPWFFLADVRRCQPAGGGFWSLGVELTYPAHDRYRDRLVDLKKLAAHLIPPLD